MVLDEFPAVFPSVFGVEEDGAVAARSRVTVGNVPSLGVGGPVSRVTVGED